MVLVTGATGFLGSELIRQLNESGGHIRALKRSGSAIPEVLKELDIEWVNGDLLDYFSLEAAFDGITHVYHCAAQVSFDPAYKKHVLKTNQVGTYHIVNLCLDNNVEKLVHVSSVAALGEARHGGEVTEQTHWEFNGKQHGYSISKYESEMEVWRAIAEGLNAVIVNPSVIIGANAGKAGSGQIFDMVQRGLRFYTRGSLGVVDVEDVAKAMILLMDSELSAERYILNAENLACRQLFKQTSECFGIKAPNLEAKPWLMEIGWRAAGLLSLFTGKNYALTKDSARSSLRLHQYSSSKFLSAFPKFQYKPISNTIQEICRKLKR
ncbi:NAD-dependent epimerase/dehydratase family protein [Desertivirga xinjiangensis]|uniref:NAD-dependent epimerase/dehydratase family protein n=1 Tax=Desertivirga xinjiangensis TaxID=539206 RepID=UPI00210E982D|nr:NAD-dependent epimerase/dehydratase family protein [Pedobacter xinjiangensis]